MPRAKKQKKQPLGFAIGMLAASSVSLWGIFAGFDPDVILLRAIVSAVCVGMVVSLGQGMYRLVQESESKSRQKLERN